MGFYGERVLPRVVDIALSGKAFSRARERVAAELAGEVLEIGFGSGRNVPFYPVDVARVQAVDPALAGRKIAAKRLAASQVAVEFVGVDGAQLPLEDTSVDHVLTTWTLCTIPDVARALGEIRRVLRPGGALHFVEHGRSPEPKVRRRQDLLTPLQRHLGGGCHLNRPIDALIAAAGLELVRLDNYYVPGPRPYGYMYEGVAVRASG